MSQFDESVQRQVRVAFDLLEQKRENTGTPTSTLADAYGHVGKLLMAARDVDLAEPYFLNAQELVPGDRRWPYYLGHLYRTKGAIPQAAAAFERALTLAPADVPTLIWLGELRLLDGHAADAAPLFARALSADPRSLAARFGLGRVALAQRDYRGAVEHLEAVLRLDLNAVGAHYPLALAYRGLGDIARADAHAQQRGNADLLPIDPLMDELRALLHSAVSYELAGTRALNGGDWQTAIAEFRKGLVLDPSSPALQHKLGTALYLSGDIREAEQTFMQVARESPTYAKAFYSLGVLLASEGRDGEAIARLSTAVSKEPAYVEAHVSLAELLRKAGRLREAVIHYDRALELDPRMPAAALGRALTLIRLQRYAEARDRLQEAVQVHPHDPWLAHALARLLAAAPDDKVRDGESAVAVMQKLAQDEQRLDLGETMAMALAEAGRYQEAASWQRSAIDRARQTGQVDLAAMMTDRLRLYESKRPSRIPWRPGELD